MEFREFIKQGTPSPKEEAPENTDNTTDNQTDEIEHNETPED